MERAKRRPTVSLWRRVFTTKRLDNLHRGTVYVLMGGTVLVTAFFGYNMFFYYRYQKPLVEIRKLILEQELLEADEAGF